VIVQLFRADLAQAKVVNQEKLPAVAKKVYDQINTDPNTSYMVRAARETFEYQLNGQTVQEIVSGVLEASISKVGNPTGLQYWTIVNASSRRAVKGQLDQLAAIEQVMAQSLQINPDWLQRVNAQNQQRYQQALGAQRQQLANQQAQFNAIESRIASQSAANDAQHASYWAHSADLARQSENEGRRATRSERLASQRRQHLQTAHRLRPRVVRRQWRDHHEQRPKL
jgi:leucyl aminopeptidase